MWCLGEYAIQPTNNMQLYAIKLEIVDPISKYLGKNKAYGILYGMSYDNFNAKRQKYYYYMYMH